MIIVLMGVAGSGKTTVGTRLAAALGCLYLDGDALHPGANIEKMMRGLPLTDADRQPWLEALHSRLFDAFHNRVGLVVGCSALKRAYRARLRSGVPITWVYLKADKELIRSRLRGRVGHFFQADLIASQFAELEEPSNAIVVDVSPPVAEIVEQILHELRDVPDVKVFANEAELAAGIAVAAGGIIEEAVDRFARCSVVLSGGESPKPFHRRLATDFHDRIRWDDVHFFWGDERCVPYDDERSNYRMARDTLLDHVPYRPENAHPMPTGFADPDTAAREYEATLKAFFGEDEPRFDLVVLGLGADGHTASLFPYSPALAENERWVAAVPDPPTPPIRLTLTLPALNRSEHTFFLVTGAGKAEAVARVLSGRVESESHPAAGILPLQGRLVWWLDREAAAEIGT